MSPRLFSLLVLLFHTTLVGAQSATTSPAPSAAPSASPSSPAAPSVSPAPSLSSCILTDGFIGEDSSTVTYVAVEFDYYVATDTSSGTVQDTSLPILETISTSYIAPLLIDACGSSAAADIVGIDIAPTDQVLLYDNGTAVECDTPSSTMGCFRIHSEWTIYVSTTASGVDAAFETAFDDYVSGSSFAANPDFAVVIYSTTSAPSTSPTDGGFDGCTESFGDFKDCTSDCFGDFGECYGDLKDEILAFKDENTTMFYVIIAVIVLTIFCCIFACCKCCSKSGDGGDRKGGDDDDSDDESDDDSEGTDSDDDDSD